MTDTGPKNAAPASSQVAPAAEDLMREQRLQRNLKILVGFLGFLILAGLMAVVIRIVMTAAHPPGAVSMASAVATPGGEIALEIPRGAKVVSVSVSGNRLVVHHESPTGTGIAVLDLETGRRIFNVKPIEATPRE